jgi:Tol biopolymer transport system component
VSSAWDKYASAVSPDGQLLAYIENLIVDKIWLTPLDGSGARRALSPNAIAQRGASFSSDGRWIAYEEIARGRPNVFVTSSSGTGARRQVSVDGGEQPHWTRGGREIVFRKGEAMMAAPVDPASVRLASRCSCSERLSPIDSASAARIPTMLLSDGSRFLLVLPNYKPNTQPVIVVLNWLEELRARLQPAK